MFYISNMSSIMIFGTIISTALALLLALYPNPIAVDVNWIGLSLMIIFISFAFFCLLIYLQLSAWMPLQQEEKNFAPRVLQLYRKDPIIRLASLGLELLPLISIFLALLLYLHNNLDKLKILCCWVVLLGISIDLTRNLLKRIQSFVNPYGLVAMMTNAAKSSIQNDRETELCGWIDSISEIALKAIPRCSASLASDSLNELQNIAKFFLESSKSIGHPLQDKETIKMGISDKINYTLFYIFQRLELINEKAIEKKLEPICSNVVTALGKIALNAARCDISLTNFPVHYLGKCAVRAQQHGLEEVGVKASLTLFEVAKTLLNILDPSFQVIKDTYFSIIAQMHEIAKETFRQNKETRIDLLTQPFRVLKTEFTSEKLINHPDTPEIVSKINAVLSEFDALELVLRTIPPIPKFSEESSSESVNGPLPESKSP